MLDFELGKAIYMSNGDIDTLDILITGDPANEDFAWETDVDSVQNFYNYVVLKYADNFKIATDEVPYKIRKDICEWIEHALNMREPEWDESLYSEDDYDEWLRETYSDEVNIGGHTYDVAYALKEVDPVAYNCGFNDYLNLMLEEYFYTEDYQNSERGFNHIMNEFKDLWHAYNPEPEGYIDPRNIEEDNE